MHNTGPKKVEILERHRVFDGFFKIDQTELRYERFDGSMTPITAPSLRTVKRAAVSR